MKITFLGATKTVTGSNFLVEAAVNANDLIEEGMKLIIEREDKKN